MRSKIPPKRRTIEGGLLSEGWQCRCFLASTAAATRKEQGGGAEMVKVVTFFGMALGAFMFWQTMDRLHVWIALHQDEKLERLEREREIKRVRQQLLVEAKEKESIA